jgi:hypothetical protein
MDEIAAASAKIGDLAYMVALKNAKVVSDDPDQALSVVFNSMVSAAAKAIAVAVSAGRPMGPEEWASHLGKIQRELMSAAHDVMVKNAGDGFKMMIFGS